MIKNVRVNSDNEINYDGAPVVGDVYNGLCCAGHDWEVVIVFGDHQDDGVWGVCSNPDCQIIEGGFTKEGDHFHGVTDSSAAGIAEMLLDGSRFSESVEIVTN